MWYEEWFDHPEYELVYQDRDEGEADKLVDLLERITDPEPEAAILDVGCGRGRHARALARRGYYVTGIDLSETAIDSARRRANEEGLDILFKVGDMRDTVCDCCFDGVINVFTAFGYFDDEDDHVEALKAMARALRKGGWFVQDFFNAHHVVANLVPEDHHVREHTRIHQRRWVEDGRVIKKITLATNGARQSFHESVRLFKLDDFRRMYDAAGLELLDTYGNYDGAPFNEAMPRLIMRAKKTEKCD